MFTNLTDLLLLSIASAIGPGQIILDTLLLRSPDRGVLRAGSFVGGMTAVRLVQGILFGFVLSGAVYSVVKSGHPHAISSTILLILGIILLITAYKQWQGEDNPDGVQPKWFSMIDRLTPVKAFGIGIVLVTTSGNLWVFTLNAIALISESQLKQPASIITFLFFILLAEFLVVVPIVFRIVFPKQATKFLDELCDWLIRHNRHLVIVTSLLFGSYFLVKGIAGLQA